MHKEDSGRFDLPGSCPFTISQLALQPGSGRETWLIREHDPYGEYPHIYVKICQTSSSHQSPSGGQSLSSLSSTRSWGRRQIKPGNHTQADAATSSAGKVIILSDAGCSTEVSNTTLSMGDSSSVSDKARGRHEPEVWNLRTFLEYTINPGGRIPYLVLSTHCHYDHILGLAKLPPTTAGAGAGAGAGADAYPQDLTTSVAQHANNERTSRATSTVLASSHDKSIVTPYSNLQEHSLCKSVGLEAPRYTMTWVDDMSHVTWNPTTPNLNPKGVQEQGPTSVPTQVTVLHTPGHTPDSLSWYDADLGVLCVGDAFYLKETDMTRTSPWGPEPPMPTIFPLEGNMVDLWKTMRKLLEFVRARDTELQLLQLEPNSPAIAVHDDDGQQSVSTASQGNSYSHSRSQDGFCHSVPNRQSHLSEPLFGQSGGQRAGAVDGKEGEEEGEDWPLVDLLPASRGPRKVRLAAGHTTVSLDDAAAAIVSFWEFMARVLRDEIPKVRLEDGSRGEERWLWDYALEQNDSQSQPCLADPNPDLRYLRGFSVIAPLTVIEEGRKDIPAADISRPNVVDVLKTSPDPGPGPGPVREPKPAHPTVSASIA